MDFLIITAALFLTPEEDKQSREIGNRNFRAKILRWHGEGYKSCCVSNSKVFFGIIINIYFSHLLLLRASSLRKCGDLWESIFSFYK